MYYTPAACHSSGGEEGTFVGECEDELWAEERHLERLCVRWVGWKRLPQLSRKVGSVTLP